MHSYRTDRISAIFAEVNHHQRVKEERVMNNDIIIQHNTTNLERMRSQAEILAKYNKDCQRYKTLKANSDPAYREQLLMVYTEIKLLGWVLGKTEQKIIKEANF